MDDSAILDRIRSLMDEEHGVRSGPDAAAPRDVGTVEG